MPNTLREHTTIAGDIGTETVIKKSRFLCALFRVENMEEATEKLAKVRKKHYNATHNCYAMILGADRSAQKASDDGEPQGTAGVPMLDALQKSGVTNVLAVVTRYFGGVMLGAGGLARAYGGCVAQALQGARLTRNIPADEYECTVGYADYGKLQSVAGEFGASAEGEFGEAVTVRLTLPQSERGRFEKRVKEAFLGADVVERTGETYIRQPV